MDIFAFIFPAYQLISLQHMNRSKDKKNSIKPKGIYQEIQVENHPQQNLQSKTNKSSKNGKKKTKAKSLQVHNSSQSQQSQILQIRHGDDVSRDHVRPSFIRRWDGHSNQLELTQDQLNDLSPMLQVYWKVKSKNMNTIILVEVGREYMALQNDAIKLHQIFKKKLNIFSKFLMVSFWGKETEIAKKQLFEMKIPLLIMSEFQDAEYRQKYSMVRREIAQVITPALHLSHQDQTPRSRLLLAIYHKLGRFAVLVLDSQSNHFWIDEYQEDAYFHEVRRIINKYHPVQLLIPNKQHRQISQIAKQICNPYINQLTIHQVSVHSQIIKYALSNSSPFFKELQESYQNQIKSQENQQFFSKFRMINALQMVWNYLSSLSLVQKIFFEGIFHSLKQYQPNHFFDSQVYQNLQIFRITSSEEQSYAKNGTLMGYLDYCRTQQGRKLLHKWIDNPLIKYQDIIVRQQAVSELLSHPILQMHERFDAYAKLDKRLGDIYHWVSRNSEKGKLILTRYINYEKDYDSRKNPAVVKLREIIEILKLIESYESLLKEFQKIKIGSKLLKKNIELIDIQSIHLFTIQEISKLVSVPQIAYVADIILRRISYDEVTGSLQPLPGQSELFDEEKKEIDRINIQLEAQLQKWKQHFNTGKVTYVSVRAKNQIQIPKTAINKSQLHKDLIFSSQIANFTRYTTHETYQLSQQLIRHQKGVAQSYQPFLQEIIEHFCRYKFLWDLYLQSISKIDVLVSLAKAAKSMPVKCLPKFVQNGMCIKKGFHANLLAIKKDIVPNSIEIKDQQKIILLTGPNMGGKSTFLKQICTFAILAQIGSYVPAQSYSSVIYDQIFCRMGASDRIYEGKSTFYVQLQETKRILSGATSRSLVVIDQLGRGTSTFDGMAIAQAILDHLIQKTQSVTLYSTHYTQITQKFTDSNNVKLMKMGYEQDNENINFTYQVVEGVAQKSFANNVGRMVGIPEQILKKAEIRSKSMHQQIARKKMLRKAFKYFGMNPQNN